MRLLIVQLLLTAVCCCSSEEGTCDAVIDRSKEQLFKVFERSLLSDGGNVYRIRKLLFPAITAFPELAMITYQLGFVEGNFLHEYKDCSCHANNPSTTGISITNITTLRYGWTTIGLYTYIHPALLNQLQPQLPFLLMRLAAPNNIPFLWDGCNNLPSVTIDLTVPLDNITCVPSLTEVDDVLKTLTAHLRYYVLPERSLVIGQPELDKYYVLEENFVSIDCYNNWSMCTNPRRYHSGSFLLIFLLIYVSSLVLFMILSIIVLALINGLIKSIQEWVYNQLHVPMISSGVKCTLLVVAGFTIGEIWALQRWNGGNCSLQLTKLADLIVKIIWSFIINLCFVKYFCRSSLLLGLNMFCVINSILWFPSMFISVLTMGFAYPLYVSSLVAFHIAIIYILTIYFAVLPIYSKGKLKKKLLSCCSYCFAIPYILIKIVSVYILFLSLFAHIIAQGLIPSTGIKAAVTFMPSLGIFIIGQLLKTHVLARASQKQSNDNIDTSPEESGGANQEQSDQMNGSTHAIIMETST